MLLHCQPNPRVPQCSTAKCAAAEADTDAEFAERASDGDEDGTGSWNT